MLWGLLMQRCPRCRKGPIFEKLVSRRGMATRTLCPVCGLKFEREEGYFLGAMYASYGFGLLTTAYWLPLLLLDVSPLWVIGLPTLQLVLQIPISFRYSRAAWLYLDRGFDPDEREEAV